MSITVHKTYFSNRSDVLDDIKNSGFWPVTYVSGPSPGLAIHWHTEEVHAYVCEGETSFLDGESGKRYPLSPGDKVVVPHRTLHAEGEVKDRVVYIVAVPMAMPFGTFLQFMSPEEL